MEETVELQEYIKAIKKYKWHIVLGTLLSLVLAIVYVSQITPVYESSIQLMVSQRQVVADPHGSSAGEAYQSILLSERLAKTFSQILQNRSTAEMVIEQLGVPMLPRDLAKKIKAEPIRDTQLINITVIDTDPDRAQQIANTTGVVFRQIVNDMDINRINGGKLRIDQPFISVSVVEKAAEPLEPIEPQPIKSVTIGLIIGLLLSTGAAFLLSHLDTTIKDTGEVEKLSGFVSLGQIPLAQKHNQELVVQNDPQSHISEAFRILRTNFQYINFNSDIKTIIVTSASASEGKTLFSANFAVTLASSGSKVLIVSCDLRKPRLHRVFNTSNNTGLANILIGTSALNKAIVGTDIENLDILVSGPTPPNPVDLLESKRAERFFEVVREHYDFVVMDCPPVSTITDTLVLTSFSDAVILLARHNQTRREAFLHAKTALKKVNARVIGFVLNAVNNSTDNYYGNTYVYHDAPKPSGLKRLKKIFAVFTLR